jgi:hypothetical protein
MDEQRVPDLEELDEQQVRHFLAELFSDLEAVMNSIRNGLGMRET